MAFDDEKQYKNAKGAKLKGAFSKIGAALKDTDTQQALADTISTGANLLKTKAQNKAAAKAAANAPVAPSAAPVAAPAYEAPVAAKGGFPKWGYFAIAGAVVAIGAVIYFVKRKK